MKIDVFGRRAFLLGGGFSLAVPFLPSLLPSNVKAQGEERRCRYVQVLNPYGPATRHLYADLAEQDKQLIEEFVAVKPLSDVAGDISPMLAGALSELRDKITLIHGMDVISRNANHNWCFPTCASSYAEGLDGDNYPPVSGQPSIDVLMANSDKVYASGTPAAQRLLVLNPVETDGYSETRSFSWQRNASGEIEMVRPTKSTLGLFDLLASGWSSDDEDATTTDGDQEALLLNALQDDYRAVANGSRLGRADRERLEAYMDLLHDAVRPAAVPSQNSCVAPELADEVDIDAKVMNQIRLLTAAMACGVNRVASLTLGASQGYDVRHTDHHDFISVEDDIGLVEDLVTSGRWVGELVRSFDSMPHGEGTLLDESLIYWSAQYGNVRIGDAHRSTNMPVMVAGSAAGQLQTGYYVDYRKDGHLKDDEARGIPINNLLVTFMNCMGLGSSDYETEGRVGYGDYVDEFFDNPLRAEPERWASTEGRRAVLPFFYRGPELG